MLFDLVSPKHQFLRYKVKAIKKS
jgi:hypothetical protein